MRFRILGQYVHVSIVALTAVEANWLDCLFYDASDLVNEMDASIQVIARALVESGTMAAEDLNRLLALTCGEQRIALSAL